MAEVPSNLFDGPPGPTAAERFDELAAIGGVRVERIVSTGQTTPEDAPYDQDHDEWVAVLSGAARLWIDGAGERPLGPGDHVLIPARRRHRVTWTAPDRPTVWLAVHFPPRRAGLSETAG